MTWLVKRTRDGKYVTSPGMLHSYTRDLREARQYQSQQEAEADRCGNETITTIEQECGGRKP